VNDSTISTFIDNIYQYKIQIKSYNYMVAIDNFKNICKIFNTIDSQLLNELISDDNLAYYAGSNNSNNGDGGSRSRTSSWSETQDIKR